MRRFFSELHSEPGEKGTKKICWRNIPRIQWRQRPKIADVCHLSLSNANGGVTNGGLPCDEELLQIQLKNILVGICSCILLQEGRGTRNGTKPLKALRGYRASNRGSNRGSRVLIEALKGLERHTRGSKRPGALFWCPFPFYKISVLVVVERKWGCNKWGAYSALQNCYRTNSKTF